MAIKLFISFPTASLAVNALPQQTLPSPKQDTTSLSLPGSQCIVPTSSAQPSWLTNPSSASPQQSAWHSMLALPSPAGWYPLLPAPAPGHGYGQPSHVIPMDQTGQSLHFSTGQPLIWPLAPCSPWYCYWESSESSFPTFVSPHPKVRPDSRQHYHQ